MSPELFTPFAVRGLRTENRLWVSPMCQYSAVDGLPQDWHLVHLSGLALGGPGLIVAEATGVSPEGRITPACPGLWNEEQTQAWARIVSVVEGLGVPMGIQLSHAGRKASVAPPFQGGGPVDPEAGGWQTVGPSPLAFGPLPAPRELSTAEIEGVVADFAAAARRAEDAGFRVVEVHAAHGYLAHQFLSPLSNHREDGYGGSRENRARFLFEVVEAIRAAVSPELALFVRLSANDWVEGGWGPEDAAWIAEPLRQRGVDLLDVSSGGLDPRQRIDTRPGYQVPFAAAVKRASSVPVAAVGLLTQPRQFEQVLEDGAADAVFVARQELRDRMLPLRAAAELGVQKAWPPQYERAAAHAFDR